jgi:deoxyribonuclease V
LQENILKFNLNKAAFAQRKLASRLIIKRDLGKLHCIAGADFGYQKHKGLIGAVVVVLKFPELEIIEVVEDVRNVSIPYISGYLSFREGPSCLKAILKLKTRPDLTLIDGNGIAHPRRMGLASYVGVVLDVPTVGCAKTPVFPFDSPGPERGAFSLYKDRERKPVGYCLRTQTSVKPVFVSPGHRVDFASSREVVLACSKFRIPEPVRIAHHLAKKLFR